jgi:fatty acid desaturase
MPLNAPKVSSAVDAVNGKAEMKKDSKHDNPAILAFAFGLAAFVLIAKGVLAIFWQHLPSLGVLWILVGVVAGIISGWSYLCRK